MIAIPAKIQQRLTDALKKYQPVLRMQKDKDVNESDTVVIITDLLSDLFGYDKYTEITSEYMIKKTFCDLAIKIKDKLHLLIECKAIGLALKDDYIKQAIDYASNSGVDWVILTNGCEWKIFKVTYSKPINKELVYEFNLLDINPKKQTELEMLYCISKEALIKSALDEIRIQKQTLSKFCIGQLFLFDPVLNVLKRQLKQISPDIKVTNEDIKQVIVNDILKRDVLEGEEAIVIKKRIKKAFETPVKKAKLEVEE